MNTKKQQDAMKVEWPERSSATFGGISVFFDKRDFEFVYVKKVKLSTDEQRPVDQER